MHGAGRRAAAPQQDALEHGVVREAAAQVLGALRVLEERRRPEEVEELDDDVLGEGGGHECGVCLRWACDVCRSGRVWRARREI